MLPTRTTAFSRQQENRHPAAATWLKSGRKQIANFATIPLPEFEAGEHANEIQLDISFLWLKILFNCMTELCHCSFEIFLSISSNTHKNYFEKIRK
jgi:hypothetical protein